MHCNIHAACTCYSRLVSQAQSADTHDNAGWDFDIGEDKEFDFDEEIRLSSGIGRRKTVRCIVVSITALHVRLTSPATPRDIIALSGAPAQCPSCRKKSSSSWEMRMANT